MTTPPASFRLGNLMPITEIEHIALLWLAAYEDVTGASRHAAT